VAPRHFDGCLVCTPRRIRHTPLSCPCAKLGGAARRDSSISGWYSPLVLKEGRGFEGWWCI